MPSAGGTRPRVYWDSCVWLHYLEAKDAAKLDIIEKILDDASKESVEIYPGVTTLERTVRKLLRQRKAADGTPMTMKGLAMVIGISRQSLCQLLAGRWVGSLRSGKVRKTSPALQRLREWMHS